MQTDVGPANRGPEIFQGIVECFFPVTASVNITVNLMQNLCALCKLYLLRMWSNTNKSKEKFIVHT